jgi:hypothetical protein
MSNLTLPMGVDGGYAGNAYVMPLNGYVLGMVAYYSGTVTVVRA